MARMTAEEAKKAWEFQTGRSFAGCCESVPVTETTEPEDPTLAGMGFLAKLSGIDAHTTGRSPEQSE